MIDITRLTAARKYFEAQEAEAQCTLEVYLSNAAGIGEHPQIMGELRGQIEILTNAKDNIGTIDKLIEIYS
jgi:hypothetical protein